MKKLQKKLSHIWQEIIIPFKIVDYNERIVEILNRSDAPKEKPEEMDSHRWQRLWKPAFEELYKYAKEIKLPTYHLYDKNGRQNTENIRELVSEIRVYAQARFGQMIGLFAIIISIISITITITVAIFKH